MLTIPAPQRRCCWHHAYGSNGIILEVELALAPVHRWIERLDVFDDFADALNYAKRVPPFSRFRQAPVGAACRANPRLF